MKRIYIQMNLSLIACIIGCTLCLGREKKYSEKDMKAYLMVYFKDEDHSLHFALSNDGHSFTDINKGKPVIFGDTIAEQKGIRDPYIFRAPNDTFYMAMTDLHVFGQKAGVRKTQWERDGNLYGWGNNRSIVLMKSADLIHWSHTVLRVDKAFPGLDSIGCAWAPELFWDNDRHQIMMYYTMRYGNGQNRIYYTYMNKDFTRMGTFPKLLFDSSEGKSTIDGDITKVGNKYHLMYVTYGKVSGIKQAVSDSLNAGYISDSAWVDPEPKSCEAPTVFKRIGQNKWVLVYDIYGISPPNFGFSETSDFIHFTDLGHFNEGVMKATNFSSPKHAGFMQITGKEAKRLAAFWHLDMKF